MISDCGSITWYEPPPVVTETDNTVISVADSTQLVRGDDGLLSWNFTLTDEQFTSALLAWENVIVASIQPSLGLVTVLQGFKDRFNVTWSNSQRATLVIFNVTTEYDGDFFCKASSFGGGNLKEWTRKIQVSVVGKALRSFRTQVDSYPVYSRIQNFVIVVAPEIGIILPSIYK